MSTQARKTAVLNALQAGRLLKVITGIANHDVARVQALVEETDHAAKTSSASVLALDVSAKPDVVTVARASTQLPLFASSVNPQELAEAIRLGADVAELGNYDALYDAGAFFTADDVLALTRETLTLLPSGSLLSVTVPGHLSREAQQQLAVALQTLGVTMLQSEGAVRQLAHQPATGSLSAEEKAAISFTNTALLVQATRLPVIAASGITAGNIAQAFEAGASAVGVGRSFSQLTSATERHALLTAMVHAVVAASDRLAPSLVAIAA